MSQHMISYQFMNKVRRKKIYFIKIFRYWLVVDKMQNMTKEKF